MRTLALVTLALGVSASVATAGPITAGVSLGLAESKADAGPNVNASQTLGLYGRLGFTPRLSGQLEISRIQTDSTSNTDIRNGTALLVFDLGARGHLVPVLLAGVGLDYASATYASSDAVHVEGGLGLEYRAPGGLLIGADVRIGDRSLQTSTNQAVPYATGGALALVAPSTLRDGEYRAARLTVGVRF